MKECFVNADTKIRVHQAWSDRMKEISLFNSCGMCNEFGSVQDNGIQKYTLNNLHYFKINEDHSFCEYNILRRKLETETDNVKIRVYQNQKALYNVVELEGDSYQLYSKAIID